MSWVKLVEITFKTGETASFKFVESIVIFNNEVTLKFSSGVYTCSLDSIDKIIID